MLRNKGRFFSAAEIEVDFVRSYYYNLNIVMNISTENMTSVIINVSEYPVKAMANSPTAFLHAYIAVRIFLGILAISGNSLTLAAIWKFENLCNPTNNLIASLAVADVLGGCVSFFLLTTHLLKGSRIWIPIFYHRWNFQSRCGQWKYTEYFLDHHRQISIHCSPFHSFQMGNRT